MRSLLPYLAAVAVGAAVVLLVVSFNESRTVRIGVLHSLTGNMATSEAALVDAVQLAVDEINESGGVLGRQIDAVIADARSEPEVAAAEAGRLIDDENVQAVFGCWTSSCRRTVRPVIEERDNILFYPLQYEGVEASPNVVYLGAAPNQQILPALRWSLAEHGSRVFLVGSDYIFPRTASEIIRGAIDGWQGEIVGEEYLTLGATSVQHVVDRIVETQPDIILSTINGDTNIEFFRTLRAAGVDPATIPTISFSLAETELRAVGPELVAGDYAAWTYFQSVPGPDNAQFVADFRARFGSDRVTDDPVEAAYTAVHLWALAAERAGSIRPTDVREAIGGLSIGGPGGLQYVEPTNQHLWKAVRIGQIRTDGQFEIVWESSAPVRPVPFPDFRSRESWESFADSLYQAWGSSWTAPG